MDFSTLTQSHIAVALLIFCARILDVSIGTIRIILVSRGYRALAPIFGFFEVLIWLMAIRQILAGLDHFYLYLVYAAGFATGNYVGMLLEARIAIGYQAIRIITTEKIVSLPVVLRQEGFGATLLKGWGGKGEVTVVFTIVPRKRVKDVLTIVNMLEPKAFVSVEDVKARYAGFFGDRTSSFDIVSRFPMKRK